MNPNYLDDIDQIGQKGVTHVQSSDNKQNEQTSAAQITKQEDYRNLQIFVDDPCLRQEQFYPYFVERIKTFLEIQKKLQQNEKGLENFALSYKEFGLNRKGNKIVYTEWAPGAKQMYLTGDFCNWNKTAVEMKPIGLGRWQVELQDKENGESYIPHNSKIKVYMLNAENKYVDRIPIWIKYAVQQKDTFSYDGVYWCPKNCYKIKYPQPGKIRSPKIYETHIGMAGVEPRIHTYQEFIKVVLPRVKNLGYNIIQMMAIAEHAYYGSFGYHVTLPFGICSRFGTPDDFKELIDQCHKEGISVLIDLVHSHASTNVDDGINNWDGTEYQYFHEGARGKHLAWDSRVYNYGNWETLRLLLSNISYFMNEYKVDGFRFDGVTSMLYKHHGIGFGFTGNYHEYFGNDFVDKDAITYLMLANHLIHSINQNAITIAEDVSGLPTLCRPINEGGIGFDYRMQMAVPDKWIQLVKEIPDDQWSMGSIVHALTNRRYKEPCVAYSESHDQALVGDKTLAQWLFDIEIYSGMTILITPSLKVSRGMALHKMIRLLTLSLAGEGFLCFMGNEFGHPEWIDFPREGNNWSYQFCRRRFDLSDTEKEPGCLLRFRQLEAFDKAMIKLEEDYQILSSSENFVSEKNEHNKIISFERANLLFVFNFHPNQSLTDYKIGTKWEVNHKLIMDSDQTIYGGQGLLVKSYDIEYPCVKQPHQNRPCHIIAYIPCRCVLVFAPILK